MRLIYSCSCAIIRSFMKVVADYNIIGKNNLRNLGPCIIAANHISFYDPPFIGSIMGKEIYYLAKRELFNVILFKQLISYYNAIPIKRGTIDREATTRVKQLLKEGKSILLFPEGSRKSFTAKPGIGLLVYDTGFPVLPIKIENSNNIMDCLMRKKKLKIVVGEKIGTKSYQQLPAEKNTYKLIANDILNTINNLDSQLETDIK